MAAVSFGIIPRAWVSCFGTDLQVSGGCPAFYAMAIARSRWLDGVLIVEVVRRGRFDRRLLLEAGRLHGVPDQRHGRAHVRRPEEDVHHPATAARVGDFTGAGLLERALQPLAAAKQLHGGE